MAGAEHRITHVWDTAIAERAVQFAPENGLAFFENLGWRVVEAESLFSAAHRFHRLPMLMRATAWLPQPDPRRPGRRPWSAVALLAR